MNTKRQESHFNRADKKNKQGLDCGASLLLVITHLHQVERPSPDERNNDAHLQKVPWPLNKGAILSAETYPICIGQEELKNSSHICVWYLRTICWSFRMSFGYFNLREGVCLSVHRGNRLTGAHSSMDKGIDWNDFAVCRR
jgi:hypothetical protein